MNLFSQGEVNKSTVVVMGLLLVLDWLLRNRVLHSLTVVVSVIDYANHCGRRPLNESRPIVVSG